MGLFNEPEDRPITAFDINDNPHQRSLKNFKFRVSAYGLLKNGDDILVTKNPESDKFGLPGGAIELGEKITEALIREFKEETGLDVKVDKLLNVSENFFTYSDLDAHNIIIVYSVEKIGGEITPDGNGDDTMAVLFKSLDALKNGQIQSIFKDLISSL